MICKKNLFKNVFLIYFTFIEIRFFKCQRQTPIKINSTRKEIDLSILKSDYEAFNQLLQPIAIVRMPDTPGIEIVKKYLVSKMNEYGWKTELDEFHSTTPLGEKRIVFACHYDSKYFPKDNFIGATDSAVPCAILLDMARFLHENFNKTQFQNINRFVQFIFFDGEEAFHEWSSKDSIYGSKHYAEILNQAYGSESFDKIDLFVLLDLLGGDSSSIYNYFPKTSSTAYNLLAEIETILRDSKMLSEQRAFYFPDKGGIGSFLKVEDDHLPFLNRDVPILHLIPSPFPTQWHTPNDNLKNLNHNTIQDLRVIMKYFLLRVLEN